MYGGNAQVNKVVNTCSHAVSGGCATLCKGKILALIYHAAVLID